MKERLYVQLEVEVQNMDEDYTEIFLVPADDTEKANKIESMLHEGYSVDEVLEEFPDVFYIFRRGKAATGSYDSVQMKVGV